MICKAAKDRIMSISCVRRINRTSPDTQTRQYNEGSAHKTLVSEDARNYFCLLELFDCKKSMKKKENNTRDSNVVPDRSTDLA